MLSAMDDAIGLVLDELDSSGRADNALVVFHNDNGGPTTRNAVNGSSNAPFRGSKCETFEGGIRVPLCVRWPGVIRPGTVYREPVITFDVSATALHVADADRERIDGVNLVPFLSGQCEGSPHEALFWRSRTRSNNYGMRKDDWKFAHSTEGRENPGPGHTPARDMLFNLADDPGEQQDLSETHPDKLQELMALYAAWSDEVDADCRKLGIEPPAAGGSNRSRSHADAGPIHPTESFPGFDKLADVELKESDVGFELASRGNGLALRKLERAVTGQVAMRLVVQPRDGFPSNGFLAFGKEPTDAGTVKCGLLVGGNRVSVFCGPYGAASSEASVPLAGGKPYDVTAAVNIADRTVILSAAGKSVTHPLPGDIDEIRYVGYYIVRARGQFSPISVTSPEPQGGGP
jgi:hypothetical protein